MPALAVLGAQWGDEAKGKVAHVLARDAQFSVRFNGGPNAGHTVQDGYGMARMHQVPVGALHPGCVGVLAHGMALDLWALWEELEDLREQGRPEPVLAFSPRVHLILPHHKLREELEGSAQRIGTTRRGVGPCYEDRAARRGLRLADLDDEEGVRNTLERAVAELRVRGYRDELPIEQTVDALLSFRRELGERVGGVRDRLEHALSEGKYVLFEGAQGALLDLDWGTYPYVTSSTTTVHGVGWGAGIRTDRLDRVIGVCKAYTTRVGEGPFPTEDRGPSGKHMRDVGREYGATTGRPRRCGWLDLVALRYACEINGLTELVMSKLDVLTGLSEVWLCDAYRIAGTRQERFPTRAAELSAAVPVYERLPGWRADLSGKRTGDDLPRPVQRLVSFVEDRVGVPVKTVSVGPGEEQLVALG